LMTAKSNTCKAAASSVTIQGRKGMQRAGSASKPGYLLFWYSTVLGSLDTTCRIVFLQVWPIDIFTMHFFSQLLVPVRLSDITCLMLAVGWKDCNRHTYFCLPGAMRLWQYAYLFVPNSVWLLLRLVLLSSSYWLNTTHIHLRWVEMSVYM